MVAGILEQHEPAGAVLLPRRLRCCTRPAEFYDAGRALDLCAARCPPTRRRKCT